jgi:hypothetical protein
MYNSPRALGFVACNGRIGIPIRQANFKTKIRISIFFCGCKFFFKFSFLKRLESKKTPFVIQIRACCLTKENIDIICIYIFYTDQTIIDSYSVALFPDSSI